MKNSGFLGTDLFTKHPNTFLSRQAAAPEVVRIINEYEESCENSNVNSKEHHEKYSKFQKNFYNDVQALVETFDTAGNPFLEEGEYIIDYSTSKKLPNEVFLSLKALNEIGTQQLNLFMKERIEADGDNKISFTKTIHRNNLAIHNGVLKKINNKKISPEKIIKEDRDNSM